ncbi:hypothetical protein JNM05_03345 [bacterium]|nr:hypothetical protein [bacterium]
MIDQTIRNEYDKIWAGFLDGLSSFQDEYLSQAIASGNIHDYFCSVQYVPNRHLKRIVEKIGYKADFFFQYMMCNAVAKSIQSKVNDVVYGSVIESRTIRLSDDSELSMYKKKRRSVIFRFPTSISLKDLQWCAELRDYLLPYRIKYYLIGASAHVKFDEIDEFANQQWVSFLRSSYADRVKSKRVDELVDDACRYLNL